MRPLRILWNEMVAFVFVCFAVPAAFKVYSFWRDFDGEPRTLFGLILSGIFLFTMLYFAVMSFVRAKKISRTAP